MDWFSLASQVLTKKKQDVEEQETTSGETTNGVLEDLEKVEGKLDPLEAAALSCILETAFLQLYIIDVGTCKSSPNTSNIIARTKIIDVIRETEEEIRENGTFEVLYKKTKEEAEARRAAKFLTRSVGVNHQRIEDLRAKLKDHEYAKLREMNMKQEIIASLKDKIHEGITRNDAKLRYIDRWEAARQGQNRIRCQNAESELEQQLKDITNKCNNEIRVHEGFSTFLALEEQALAKEVEKWKETYEKEMKRRTEKIKYLEARKKEQEILLCDLKQLYNEHQKEINDYLDFKKKIHLEQERERFINQMAVKIQAWWRGTMVRRGLGPFKKKKKPGKDKKKK